MLAAPTTVPVAALLPIPILLLGFGGLRALIASILLLLLLKLGCGHLLYLLLDQVGEARGWTITHSLPHILLLH